MVDIYLDHVPGDTPLLALSIPLDDVQRLSNRPLKWFRFIMFAICGAKGNLFQSDTAGGLRLVNYSIIDEVVGPYFYKPDGPCMFVDYRALDDKVTSSAATDLRRDFRQDVINRDGSRCIITKKIQRVCDACHLIPRSKGDEYIDAVTRRRAHLYSQPLLINDINSAANGILLRKDWHVYFGDGDIAFLKTPNFAIDPEDIPGFQDPPPANRVTAQFLKLPPDEPISCRDASFDNILPRDGNEAPAAILLDFCYGAAAYKTWGNREEMTDLLHEKFVDQYKFIPLLQKSTESSSGEDSGRPGSDPTDGNYVEPKSKSQANPPRKRHDTSHNDVESPFQSNRGLASAMDGMSALVMRACGTSPEARMAHYRKEEQQRQLRETKASQRKVLEWMEQS